MPTMSDRMMNLFPMLFLRTPLHGMMSGKYAIIEFTGRKSGREYRTPVAYVPDGEQAIVLSTDSPWWRNLVGGATVRVWLRGKRVSGIADIITDKEASADVLRRLVEAIPSYAKPAGIERIDGLVTDEEIDRAAEKRISIRVEFSTKGADDNGADEKDVDEKDAETKDVDAKNDTEGTV